MTTSPADRQAAWVAAQLAAAPRLTQQQQADLRRLLLPRRRSA